MIESWVLAVVFVVSFVAAVVWVILYVEGRDQ